MTDTQRPETENNQAYTIDIAAGLVLAAMSTAALFWLIPNYVELGTSKHDVGPAFFPQLTAMLVLGFSLVLAIAKTIRYRKGNPGLSGTSLGMETVIWAAISVLTVLGISKLGFLFIAPLLIGLGAIVCGYRIWWIIAALAIAFPIIIDQAAWLLFTVDLP